MKDEGNPSPLSLRFAVSGYYGCGNAGDEAVLAGIRESFARRAGETVRLVALSQDPASTTRLHGLEAVDRMNMTEVRRTLGESDLLLSGGGSLLQDTTSLRSLFYYLYITSLAYKQGIPYMFYAQGLGPLRRRVSRILVRMAADRAAIITVRDEPSARLLASLGRIRAPVEVTADPAFVLAPAEPEAVDALCVAESLPRDAPLIGVALRPWGGKGESPIESYARLLKELRRRCDAQVVLVPMHSADDVVFAEQVIAATAEEAAFFVVRNIYSPSVLLGLVGRLQAMVAMRLHALIFAARAAVPLFALSYDPKVESLMHSLRLGDSLQPWSGFDPVDVAARVGTLLARRDTYVAALRADATAWEERALRTADLALACVRPQSQ